MFKFIMSELKDGYTDSVFVLPEIEDEAVKVIKGTYGKQLAKITVYDSEVNSGYLGAKLGTGKIVYGN